MGLSEDLLQIVFLFLFFKLNVQHMTPKQVLIQWLDAFNKADAEPFLLFTIKTPSIIR